ncbi:MAG TPA: OB-fold domain-containing protein [Mycobacteriales bacterium]|nr:OB-fold domain-containing protein [Mycobacteriales bacterium]
MPQVRPTPVLRGEERLFFDSARKHELVFQTCADCAVPLWYPRTVCPLCLGTNLPLTRASGRGAVYSFTTLYRAGHESRQQDVPYTIALVDLEENVRMIGDLIDVPPADVHIGMPVEVRFIETTDSMTLPAFTARHVRGA